MKVLESGQEVVLEMNVVKSNFRHVKILRVLWAEVKRGHEEGECQ